MTSSSPGRARSASPSSAVPSPSFNEEVRRLLHELNNALAGVHQVLQLVLPKLPADDTSGELVAYTHESMERAVQVLGRLSALLHSSARTESPTVTLRDVGQVVQEQLRGDGTHVCKDAILEEAASTLYAGDEAALRHLLVSMLEQICGESVEPQAIRWRLDSARGGDVLVTVNLPAGDRGKVARALLAPDGPFRSLLDQAGATLHNHQAGNTEVLTVSVPNHGLPQPVGSPRSNP